MIADVELPSGDASSDPLVGTNGTNTDNSPTSTSMMTIHNHNDNVAVSPEDNDKKVQEDHSGMDLDELLESTSSDGAAVETAYSRRLAEGNAASSAGTGTNTGTSTSTAKGQARRRGHRVAYGSSSAATNGPPPPPSSENKCDKDRNSETQKKAMDKLLGTDLSDSLGRIGGAGIDDASNDPNVSEEAAGPSSSQNIDFSLNSDNEPDDEEDAEDSQDDAEESYGESQLFQDNTQQQRPEHHGDDVTSDDQELSQEEQEEEEEEEEVRDARRTKRAFKPRSSRVSFADETNKDVDDNEDANDDEDVPTGKDEDDKDDVEMSHEDNVDGHDDGKDEEQEEPVLDSTSTHQPNDADNNEKEAVQPPPPPKSILKKDSKKKRKDKKKGKKKSAQSVDDDQPSGLTLIRAVDSLYVAADKDTVTVGDICRSLEARLGLALAKATRKTVKAHLIELISGHAKPSVGDDSHDNTIDGTDGDGASDDDNGSDDDDAGRKNEGKTKEDDSVGQAESGSEPEEEESEDEDVPDADNSSDYEDEPGPQPKRKSSSKKKKNNKKSPSTPKQSRSSRVKGGMKTRASSPKKKKRLPSHVRIHAEMVRKRQLEEARARAEELGKEAAAARAAQSEADRRRAEAIARKFQTDTDESRIQRRKDRVGLLGKLQARRFDLIKNCDVEEIENDTLRTLGKKMAAQIKVEENATDASAAAAMAAAPRLTSSNPVSISDESDSSKGEETETMEHKGEERPSIKRTNVIDDSSSDEDSDDDSDDDDDDLELEIVGESPAVPSAASTLSKAPSPSKASSALDILAKGGAKRKAARSAPKKNNAPGRATLRNALRAKQVQAGNKWLARELGYKTEQEHIRDCQLIEQRKRKQMLRIEEERTKLQQHRQELLTNGDDEALEHADVKPLDEFASKDAGDLLGVEREEEEDEELAMARAIEEEQKEEEKNNTSDSALTSADNDADFPVANDSVGDVVSSDLKAGTVGDAAERPWADGDSAALPTTGGIVEESTAETPAPATNDDGNLSGDDSDDDATVTKDVPDQDHDDATVEATEPTDDVSPAESSEGQTVLSRVSESILVVTGNNATAAPTESSERVGGDEEKLLDASPDNSPPQEKEESESNKSKKPKNSAWQAMLKKEAELMKKQKGKKSNGLLDMEADEEEDEEGVMGLEDFGFAAPDKKKDDDDEGDDAVDDDDLENVVDELSDNEGDEEAGEVARRSAAAREEKERHKEIMRRMREGYDGRRGGVAGGGTARGNLRFDQLVAADNREDAKRLGLLNEDEFDSDNEGGGEGGKTNGDDEIEDETALLDQMLKDRFLQRDREEDLEENFSDDEDADDAEEVGDGGAGSDAEEDREQERLAKRFAKRARMQRLLENHGGDEEFSQARLIDEDETMQKDLKAMKNALSRKRRQTSSSSRLGGGDSDSQDVAPKKQRRNSGSGDENAGNAPSSQKSAFSNCGSLSIALNANKAVGKRKSSFLSCGNGKNPSLSRSSSATVSKSVSLSHVLFQTGEASQSSQLPRSSSMGASSMSRGAGSRSGFGPSSNKRAKTSGSGSQSLWSAVTTNSFQKRTQ